MQRAQDFMRDLMRPGMLVTWTVRFLIAPWALGMSDLLRGQ